MAKPNVLIAANPKSLAELVKWLDGHYEQICSTSLNQAEQLISTSNIDLFVIGAHFDESRALDLINFIRLQPNLSKTPIVVVRTLNSEYADILKSTFTVMKTLRGISEYLDFGEDSPDPRTAMLEAIDRALNVSQMERSLEQQP